VVLNQLFRFTPMQTSFGCNMLALNGGRPEQLTLARFPDRLHGPSARRSSRGAPRSSCTRRASAAMCFAVSPWPCRTSTRSWRTIRQSADAAEARERLMERRWPAEEILPFIKLIDDPTHTANEDGTYNLSEIQARAILDLRLQRLTQLGVKEVTDELEELAGKIKDYLAILASRERIMRSSPTNCRGA
jgi:DNA gyrase subunit A